MPRVFISYRRDDSAAHAGRIYDRLRDHFGAGPGSYFDFETLSFHVPTIGSAACAERANPINKITAGSLSDFNKRFSMLFLLSCRTGQCVFTRALCGL